MSGGARSAATSCIPTRWSRITEPAMRAATSRPSWTATSKLSWRRSFAGTPDEREKPRSRVPSTFAADRDAQSGSNHGQYEVEPGRHGVHPGAHGYQEQRPKDNQRHQKYQSDEAEPSRPDVDGRARMNIGTAVTRTLALKSSVDKSDDPPNRLKLIPADSPSGIGEPKMPPNSQPTTTIAPCKPKLIRIAITAGRAFFPMARQPLPVAPPRQRPGGCCEGRPTRYRR